MAIGKQETSNLYANVAIEDWFSVFTARMAEAVKDSVKCGMPIELAETIFEVAMGKAAPLAMKVNGLSAPSQTNYKAHTDVL